MIIILLFSLIFSINCQNQTTNCNIYDEAHYCKMLTIDVHLSTLAISHRCICPDNFKCPKDTDDTKLSVRCHFDPEKQWNRCYLPCTPSDL
ncbi:unnamed protein product [Caenorhabditis angaria]|uniref:Uncharacterized protein n=1 Tax=Caenorhabditis angaria TaxID=860376 RepID=A0A9P1N6J8_9PELO|nr:unnamed protein product [Caenorhabditis angaria]